MKEEAAITADINVHDDDGDGLRPANTINSYSLNKKSIIKYIFIHAIIALQLLAPGFILSLFTQINPHEDYFTNNLTQNHVNHVDDGNYSDDYYYYTNSSESSDIDTLQETRSKLQQHLDVSFVYVSACIGSFLANWLYELLGISISLTISNIIAIGGLTLIGVMPFFHIFSIGQFLMGFNLGMSPVICFMYLNEINTKHDKQYIFSWIFPSIATGILLKFILVPIVSPEFIAIFLLTILSIATLLSYALPQSPMWHIKKGKNNEAEKVLKRIRNDNGPEVKNELQELYEEHDKFNKLSPTFKTSLTLMNTREFKVNLFKMIGLMTLQLISAFYLKIFIEVALDYGVSEIINKKTLYLPFMLGIIIFYATVLFTHIVLRNCDRKKLMLCSTWLITIPLVFFVIGYAVFTDLIHKYFLDPNTNSYFPTKMATISLCFHGLFYGLGMLTIPWTLFTDVFPKEVRVYGNGICLIILTICSFIVGLLSFLDTIIMYILIFITMLIFPIYIHYCFPILSANGDAPIIQSYKSTSESHKCA